MHEQAGQQPIVGVGEHAAQLKRAGRGIDQRRDVIDDAFVRIAGLGHQPQLDRDLAQIGGADALGVGDDAQHILLAEVRGHVDRIELQDRRERRRAAAADQRADRREMGRHDTVEGRGNVRVAKLDFRKLERCLCFLQVGAAFVAVLLRFVELGLPSELGRPAQRVLPLKLRLGKVDGRLRGRDLGFRLLDLCLVGRGLDDEEDVALLHHRTVFVVDFAQETYGPRDELDLIEGDGVAGQFEIAGDQPLGGLRHADLGCGRRLVFVFLAATWQCRQQGKGQNRAAAPQ